MTIKEAILTLNANAVFACERAGFDSTTVRMVEDALDAIEDALKAQEPRVMTLEEARNVEVVWAEDRSTRKVYPYIVKGNMNDSKLYKYGIQWRCWTARPTDEQREAVAWQ